MVPRKGTNIFFTRTFMLKLKLQLIIDLPVFINHLPTGMISKNLIKGAPDPIKWVWLSCNHVLIFKDEDIII